MNKIFKIVFNKTRGCYMAVSELAKNSGGVPLIFAVICA